MNHAKTLVLALVAAFSTLPAAQAQEAAGNVANGAKKAAMCIGCHGIPGYQASFPEVHRVPMISGQNAKFIVASLQAYKKGDRKHPTMRGISITLSDQDMADLGAFYEQHAGKPEAVPEQPARQPSAQVAALLAKGACISCHGANFNKPIDGAYPKIAGQHADYLFVALRSYGLEGNPHIGRNNAVMAGITKQFTRQELRAMAQYIATLPGDLRTVRQPPFRTGDSH